MKRPNYILIVLFSLVLQSCKTTYLRKDVNRIEAPQKVNFCELDKIESGEFVSTIANYTGVEEYWGLTSNTKCELDHQIYLSTEGLENANFNNRLRKQFAKLYKNYDKYSLQLRIIGKLETASSIGGFGHLGILKTQIVPYEIEILSKDVKVPTTQPILGIDGEEQNSGLSKFQDLSDVDEIVRSAVNGLLKEDLVRNSNIINVTCYANKEKVIFQKFTLKGKNISNWINEEERDITIKIGSFFERKIMMSFTSNDSGGSRHVGTIELVKGSQNWKMEKINHVTAIE